MTLWVNSRRRRGSSPLKTQDFMPVWPLTVPPRPSGELVQKKLEAWLGMHQAVAAARRRPTTPAGAAGPPAPAG